MLGQECGFYLTDEVRAKYENDDFRSAINPTARKVFDLLYPNVCLNNQEIAERLGFSTFKARGITSAYLRKGYLKRDKTVPYPVLQTGDFVSRVKILEGNIGHAIGIISYTPDLKPLDAYFGILELFSNEKNPPKKNRVLNFQLSLVYKPLNGYHPESFSFRSFEHGYAPVRLNAKIPFKKDRSSVDTFFTFEEFEEFVRTLYKEPPDKQFAQLTKIRLENFLIKAKELFYLKPLIKQ
jgi:hypothetical protein